MLEIKVTVDEETDEVVVRLNGSDASEVCYEIQNPNPKDRNAIEALADAIDEARG